MGEEILQCRKGFCSVIMNIQKRFDQNRGSKEQMHKGHQLEFHCLSCRKPITFSLFELEKHPKVSCGSCAKEYLLEDETLLRHLKLFVDLCRQIHESKEILGNASVGVDVGAQLVKIPYKLLLTRLSSSLDLMIGDQKLSIAFRLEPGEQTTDKSKIK